MVECWSDGVDCWNLIIRGSAKLNFRSFVYRYIIIVH